MIIDFSNRSGGDNVIYKIVENDNTIELYERLVQIQNKLINELEKKAIDCRTSQKQNVDLHESIEDVYVV